MKNTERKSARRYDTPGRCRSFTDKVYSGECEDKQELRKSVYATEKEFYPPKSEYNIYFGELHGHTCLSDGMPGADEYFLNIRDNAKLDFAALSDHDHGGIGKAEIFGEKWEIIKGKVKEYYEPHKFTTLLAYERDSYPWYNNMVVYYDSHEGEILPHSINGELTRKELEDMLKRQDILFAPHDTYHLEAGADFFAIDKELFPPLFEIYSRGDSTEYFDNPWNERDIMCEGGFFQDALKMGAKPGVIAASDDHFCKNGHVIEEWGGVSQYPGMTAVLAKENTLEGIFEALKARRCYGFMGSKRVYIDFRINGHYMGKEFACDGDRSVYFKIESETPVKRVTVVKNCRDYMIIKRPEQLFFDYKAENDTDSYYLRVELADGRLAWTSPVFVTKE